MDDHRIAVLLATVRYGSFSRAAEELHCSQSAVTQTMKNLETEIGCSLLTRKHSGIILTPQGEALMPFFIEADRALRELKDESRQFSEARKAPIRIGTYSSVANTFLPQLLKKYEERYPSSLFQIRIGSDHLNQWLLQDEVDLVLADERHSLGNRWYPFLEDPYVGVVEEKMLHDPKQDTISREEFFRLPFILAANNNYRTCMEEIPKNLLNVVCDDDSTLVNMVSQGLGATLLPSLCIINPPANVRILSIKPEFHRIIGLAAPDRMKPRVQQFLDFVLKEMQYQDEMMQRTEKILCSRQG